MAAERVGGRGAPTSRRTEDVFTRALEVTSDDERFLGGESLGEVRARVEPGLGRLVARDWDTCLAVLHGGINRVLLSYALVPAARRTSAGSSRRPAASTSSTSARKAGSRTVNYIPYDPLHPARDTAMGGTG